MPKNRPQLLTTTLLAQGRFLQLERRQYRDQRGEVRCWEAAQRRQEQPAALAIATLQPSNRVVLIRQYRPPLDSFVIEFPAGLLNPGENAVAAAVRELREETGYVGDVLGDTGLTSSSAGLTGELVTMVTMTIDERNPENAAPQAKLDDGEAIDVFLVPRHDLRDFLASRQAEGDILDSRLAAWATALT
ncbi:MAG TPA: NUDIX hydrolase [Lentisphaeria bacterium]|jgi:8-oxo-dGTP pyrophosphatase MutT (NUDIX family)|nr:NUDIX hydrolase [Lentisphaerota bacterium]OQC16385.1 MAG: ADP-ribose pyrophosphatase [Lentisphaerae bacterium ADurb.Bin082]HPY90029.1 NUDIX hydrolase [Lentisphaeria bacterium]HQC51534.1 NUDIX hydrolase [Lentisphaeria bacterium]HQL87921.1 NUDIX hydrolase [Lentisphaeria bacterium]